MRLSFVVITLILCVVEKAVAVQKPMFPPAPRLAITASELAKVKAAPDFAAVKAAAVARGDALLANPVVVPHGSADWIFYYACPDDGTQLLPLSLEAHQCPKCKKTYTDERTVKAYRSILHNNANAAVESLGWAWAYSGDERYAAEAKRILMQLATDYPTYPARLDRWGRTGDFAGIGARRYTQALDEGYGVIPLAKGYDLSRNAAVWNDADRKFVEDGFFRATATTLLVYNQGINNHQTWYNAGLMNIASVLGDAALVEKILTMKGGYYDQLKGSIGSDGLWYEGAMAYHDYALLAMINIVEAAQKMGLHLEDEPKFRSLFTGPLHAAYPNGFFPVINDSDPSDVRMFQPRFEWAFKTWKDPLFAQAAAWGNPERLKQLLGPQAKPVDPLSTKSENLPDAGLAILRQGAGKNAVCAFIDYGQHGGDGHGHYDKLNLMLYANGREWLLDPGRLNYSHKEYKSWVKQTAAHNTVTIEGENQQPNTGRLLYLQQGRGFSACAVESTKSYFDATLKRHLILTPKMLIDVFDVQAPLESQIDWFAHTVDSQLKPVDEIGPGQPLSPGDRSGYQHLLGGKVWKTEKASRWDFLSTNIATDAPRLRLWLADSDAQQIFSATGIGYTIDQKAPCLIRRRTGKSTRFITVYDLSGNGSYVRKVREKPGKDAELGVETSDGGWRFSWTDTKAFVRRDPFSREP